MNFIPSRLLIVLAALGILPLAFAWGNTYLGMIVLVYDLLLVGAAAFDYFVSRKVPDDLTATREFSGRFAIGDPQTIKLKLNNESTRGFNLVAKDEYPPAMELIGQREFETRLDAEQAAEHVYELKANKRGNYRFGRVAVRIRSRLGLVWFHDRIGAEESIKVYPNLRRAREMELKALGANSHVAIQRKSRRRGDGREFESMRDYVRGDELRHVSWTTTARRGKLTTRQYQVERDQAIVIALDAGRLMTARINNESKFDTAIHASLALMSAAAKGGDNCGLMVFGRKVQRYIPPKKGFAQIEGVLEALYDLEPELVEPSYSRAFRYISSNAKKRSFVIILTDLVDKHASKELIGALRLLRPRHLPLVTTIGDRDLNSAVSNSPDSIKEVYEQSAAEEIIRQREMALRQVENLGGLALDVTAQNLAPSLLETYLRVKERSLI